MKKFTKAFVLSVLLFVGFVQSRVGVAGSLKGTIAGTVADYNAAQVRLSNGVLTVPTGLITYTANQALASGTQIVFILPVGFQFTSQPTLTSTSTTVNSVSFTGRQANYTLASSLSSGGTIVVGGYNVSGATALETITLPSIALPITIQAIGYDTAPVPFGEFASSYGIQGAFNGTIQQIDLTAPSNGSQFYGTPDTLTASLGSISLQAQQNDYFSSNVPVLGTNGEPNTLSASDTASILIPGLYYARLKSVFTSSSSSCSSVLNAHPLTSSQALVFNDIPLNTVVYLCVTGNGGQIELFPDPTNEWQYGISTLEIQPTQANADFVNSVSLTFNTEPNTQSLICYIDNTSINSPSNVTKNNGYTCVGQYYFRELNSF